MSKTIILAVAVLLAWLVAVSAQTAPDRVGSRPQPTGLVQAVVSGLREDARGIDSTWRITHVYSGPKYLLGRTFSGYTSKVGHSAGCYIEPAPTLGETGIWPIKGDADGLSFFFWCGASSISYPFPSRKNVAPDYPQPKNTSSRYREAVEVAKAVETVEKAVPGEQLNLLRRFIFSRTPEVSAWAISRFGAMKSEQVPQFLRSLLANKTLSIRARLALDDALSDADDGLPDSKDIGWRRSLERVQLWKDCLDQDNGDFANEILNRIHNASLHKELNEGDLSDLLRTAIRNNSLSPDDRDFTLSIALSGRGQIASVKK